MIDIKPCIHRIVAQTNGMNAYHTHWTTNGMQFDTPNKTREPPTLCIYTLVYEKFVLKNIRGKFMKILKAFIVFDDG